MVTLGFGENISLPEYLKKTTTENVLFVILKTWDYFCEYGPRWQWLQVKMHHLQYNLTRNRQVPILCCQQQASLWCFSTHWCKWVKFKTIMKKKSTAHVVHIEYKLTRCFWEKRMSPPQRVPPCALLKEGKERDMTVLKRKR